MFHKVKNVKPLENYILEITFEDNEIKLYDIKVLFEKWTAFERLKTLEGLFEKVQVDKGGFGISWDDELDLSCNELWNNGYK